MAHKVRRKGNRYQVVDTETGKAYPPTTKVKADQQLRMLQSVERSYTKTGDGEYTRTANGRRETLRLK